MTDTLKQKLLILCDLNLIGFFPNIVMNRQTFKANIFREWALNQISQNTSSKVFWSHCQNLNSWRESMANSLVIFDVVSCHLQLLTHFQLCGTWYYNPLSYLGRKLRPAIYFQCWRIELNNSPELSLSHNR